ncbi:L,D-transpeptidase family protein [Luteolibacter flavescens]|uniref:L,D-transpeptidase family protein n=1 Tax=Luteolibacter flavescens TaxID=1859460 RepID=A0ABT3FJB2_9BACT|nr:L,D-transpeptidase family protein [Luteolibacter flavescens]MCW1883659.1 L,D-transpeptidase family protein [Luteolibacter flavescens]
MRLLVFLPALLLLPSCSLFRSGPPPKASYVMYEWDDDKGPGDVSVEIDLSSQIATYKRAGRTIGWSFVSTGKEGKSTSPGNYKVSEMMELKHSNLYGWITDPEGNVSNGDAQPTTPVPEGHTYHPAPMNHWMRLTWSGIGMHAGEIRQPGVAASHGCIRLPRDFVPKLYKVAKVGTPVKIIKSGAPKAELPRATADAGT